MNIYLVIFNDGITFRIQEIYFNQQSAINNAKKDNYQVIEFKTSDMPILDNGMNHIREIVLEDYEIE